jgi:hypothetical protein
MPEKKWSRKENWVGTAIEDAYVMVNLDLGHYVSLNCTATDAWNAIERPAPISEIVSKLTARYDVPVEHCRKSVTELLEKLEAMGLINPNDADAPRTRL